MKSIDKFVLVLVASLALLLAGCGGGSSSNTGDDNMDMDMSGPQKTALMNAHATLQRAVNALVGEATQDEVNTANAAATGLQNAINAATDVAASDLTMYRDALTNANNAIATAQNLLATQGNKEMTAMAKALKAAIDAPRGAVVVTPTSIPVFDPDNDSTTDNNTAAITLKKGASVGSLGSWTGTDYAGEAGTGDAKTTGMVRAYSNHEAAKSHSFTSEAGEAIHGLQHATTTVRGDYALSGTDATTDPDVSSEIGGFPTTGEESYDEDDTVTGTYMSAAGTYKCVAATGCTSNAEGADGIDLSGGWTFTPSANAMVLQKDASYLQFGWWVRKDKDGPTHAGVFYRSAGATALTADDGTITNTITGKATYAGSAAGKFAVSDPLRPASDNSGHFTADAELMADFKGTDGADLSGTIDNFRLNDGSDDPGWSIALQKPTAAVTNGEFGRAGDAGTVWSIGGVKTAASGAWEARMYDDKPAASSPNNTPDSVTGTFSSSIGSTHSMVGAFGAEKE